MELIAKFKGGEADFHRAPAYEAAQSLLGLTRALTLASHTLATGDVRKRTPYDDSIRLYLRPPRAGSLETVVDLIVQSEGLKAFGMATGVAVTAALVTDFLKVLFRKGIGAAQKPEKGEVEKFLEDKGGNFEALQDAIEPALKQSHECIGHGVTNILLINGDNNVVNFDADSKRYVNTSKLDPSFENMDVSVGALNVNQKTGRVFFHDLGKTVPFKVASEAAPNTVAHLSAGLGAYARAIGTRPTAIKFQRVLAPDGRTKSIIIYDAKPARDDLL